MSTDAVVFLDAETTRLDRRRRPWEIAMIRRERGSRDQEITLSTARSTTSTSPVQSRSRCALAASVMVPVVRPTNGSRRAAVFGGRRRHA
jgi:hypothetical protein